MKIDAGKKYNDDEARAKGDAAPNIGGMLLGILLCCPRKEFGRVVVLQIDEHEITVKHFIRRNPLLVYC